MCSYIKWLIKIIKHKEGTEEDVYTTWERDCDLMPNNVQGLFNEYLELGMSFHVYTYNEYRDCCCVSHLEYISRTSCMQHATYSCVHDTLYLAGTVDAQLVQLMREFKLSLSMSMYRYTVLTYRYTVICNC